MARPHEMLPHTGGILIFHFVMLLCNCGRMTSKGHMIRLWHSWEVVEPLGGGTAGVFPEAVVELWLLSFASGPEVMPSSAMFPPMRSCLVTDSKQ